MITYCTGSAKAKREYFKHMSGTVLLDNIEVLFCACENGVNCFAIGAVPFADFEVDEYLTYRRALCGKKYDPTVLRRMEIPPTKKLRRLCPSEMRCVQFLEKTAGNCDKPVVIVLDGARYSKKADRYLKNLLGEVDDAYVCVTDMRFVKHADSRSKLMTFGTTKNKKPRFYAAKELKKRIGAKTVAVF